MQRSPTQRCVQRLSHGDLILLESVQSSSVYEARPADADRDSSAILHLTSLSPEHAERTALLEVVEQGDWLGLKSPVLGGLFLQARKKFPHLVFFSPRLGVWEQWKAEALFQGVLQQSSPALCLTSRQVPGITLSVRAWKVGSTHPQRPPSSARSLPQAGTEPQLCSDQSSPGLGYAASVSSSLRDDALDLSHEVLKGYVARMLRWPLQLAFRVWRLEARAGRRRRAEAVAHHEHRLQAMAWAAMQQRAAKEQHERHMIVLACQCWTRHRANRLARALRAWHARARRSAALQRLRVVCERKDSWRRAAAVLAVWTRYTQQRRKLHLLLGKACWVLAIHRARAVLYAWREIAGEQRAVILAFEQRRSFWLLAVALRHWHALTARLAAARQTVHNTATAATAAALHAVLRAWHSLCEQHRGLRLRQQLAVAARARRLLGSVWCAWRGLVDDAVARRRRVEMVCIIRRQQLAGRVIRCWATLAGQAAVLRFAAAHLAARRERLMLPRAFTAWRAVAELATRLEEGGEQEPAAAVRLMGILRRRLAANRRVVVLRRVLGGWRQIVTARLQLRLVLGAVMGMKTHRFARRVFSAWRAAAQASCRRQQDAVESYRAAVLRGVLCVWAGVSATSRHLAVLASALRRRVRAQRLRGYLRSWRQQVLHSRAASVRAVQAHALRVTRRTVEAWRRRCAITRGAVAALARCRQGYERMLLTSALRAFARRVALERGVRDQTQRRGRTLSQRCLSAWHRHSVVSARLGRQGRLLADRWRRCVQRSVLRSWYLTSQAARLQLHLVEAMRGGGLEAGGTSGPSVAQPGRLSVDGPHGVSSGPLGRGAKGAGASKLQAPPLPQIPPPQPPLVRILETSLGSKSAYGGRGSFAATGALLELLQERLPVLSRLASRPRRHALAVFRGWRAVVESCCRLRVTAGRLDQRRRNLQMGACFSSWRAAMTDIRARRSAAMAMALRAVRAAAVACLAVWRLQARRSSRLRRTCLMLLARRTERLQRGVLVAWQSEVRAARVRVQEARKVKGDAKMALMGRAMRAWQLALDIAAELRETAEKRYTGTWTRLKRQVLVNWRQVVLFQEHHLGTCMRLLQARIDRRLQGLVLHAWSAFAQQERRRREDWPQLCRVFFAWRTLVQPAGRAAAAAEAKLAELGLDAPRPARKAAAPSPPQQATQQPGPGATTTAAGPSPAGVQAPPQGGASSTSQALASGQAALDAAVLASPPAEDLHLLDRGHGPGAAYEGLGPYGVLAAQAGPGAMGPAGLLWQHWYNMMAAGGFVGGHGAAIPLPQGGWGAPPGGLEVRQPDPSSSEETEALRERLAKLEEELRRQREREQQEPGHSSPRSGDTGEQGSAVNRRTSSPPPLPRGTSSKVLTASCRPEPGPLTQVRQQGGSSTAIGRASSRSALALAATEPAEEGAAAATSASSMPVGGNDRSGEQASTKPDATATPGAATNDTPMSGAPPPGNHFLGAGSAPTPATASQPGPVPQYQPPPPPPPGPALSPTTSWRLTASCRPEPGPLYQIREGGSTSVGRASMKSLTALEPTDSVISSVTSAAAPTPGPSPSSPPPSADKDGQSGAPSPAAEPQATAGSSAAGSPASISPPAPPPPPRPASMAGGSSRVLSASCAPEPGPLYQIRQGSGTTLGRASSSRLSLSGFDPADSPPSSTVSTPTDVPASPTLPPQQQQPPPPSQAPPPQAPPTLHLVIHHSRDPSASRSTASSSTTADSSSLGSPTSLQAWSRRTTADRSGASESVEPAAEARRQTIDLVLGPSAPDGDAAEPGARQQQQGSLAADDVLLAAASTLLQRVYGGQVSFQPPPQQQRQERERGSAGPREEGGDVSAPGRQQVGTEGGDARTGLPGQQSLDGGLLDKGSVAAGGTAAPTTGDHKAPQPPPLQQQQPLVGQAGTFSGALWPLGQTRAASEGSGSGRLELPPASGVMSGGGQPGSAPQSGVSPPPPPLQQQAPQAPCPPAVLDGGAQPRTVGLATLVLPDGQVAQLLLPSQPASLQMAPPAQQAVVNHLTVPPLQPQLASSVFGPHQEPVLRPQQDAGPYLTTHGPGVLEAVAGTGTGRLAATAKGPLAAATPEMSEVEMLLCELEAKSRSAMSSPRRQQQQQRQAGGDAAAVPRPPLPSQPVGAWSHIAAATEGSGGSAGGALDSLGLQGLDRIDALHVRASTLSAPGSSIFGPTTAYAALGGPEACPDLGDTAKARFLGDSGGRLEGLAVGPAAQARRESGPFPDPVDAALRRLEAATSMQAAAPPATGPAANAEAATSAARPIGDDGPPRAAAAVEVGTEQHPPPPLLPVRREPGLGAPAASAARYYATRLQGTAGVGGRQQSGAETLLATFLPAAAAACGPPRGSLPPTAAARPAAAPPGAFTRADQVAGADKSDGKGRPPPPTVHRQERRGHLGSFDIAGARAPVLVEQAEGSVDLGPGSPRDAKDLCPTCGSPARRQGGSPPPARPGPQMLQEHEQPPHPGAVWGRQQAYKEGACPAPQPRRVQWPSGDTGAANEPRLTKPDAGAASAKPFAGADAASRSFATGRPGSVPSAAAQPAKDHLRSDVAPLRDDQHSKSAQSGWRQQAAGSGTGPASAPGPDPLAEVARLAQRRGNHHLAAMLAGLAADVVQLDAAPRAPMQWLPPGFTLGGPLPAHAQGGDTGRRGWEGHGEQPCAQPPGHAAVKGTASRDVAEPEGPHRAAGGDKADNLQRCPAATAATVGRTAAQGHGQRATPAAAPGGAVAPLSARGAPTSHRAGSPPARAPIRAPVLTPAHSVTASESGSTASSSSLCPGHSVGSTACEAIANGFDPDPLHSPLRRMLGECRRLQSSAARLEEEGDWVVREVVAELSPRGAVAAAVAAVMQQQQQGPRVLQGAVSGGRRTLQAPGRRV